MINKITLIGFIFFFLFQVSSCKAQDNEKVEFFNVNKKTEIVFFYTKESTEEERTYFDENILTKEHPGGGYWTRDGVQTVFSVANAGFEGSGVKFVKGATKEQKTDIKKRLEDSPIIYKVFENVIVSEIVLNPEFEKKEKIRQEKSKKDTRPPKTLSTKAPN